MYKEWAKQAIREIADATQLEIEFLGSCFREEVSQTLDDLG